MEIPEEVIIMGSIKQGTIYYFQEASFFSNEPHYFVVLNKSPQTNSYVYLVNATSQIEKSLLRVGIMKVPQCTLVTTDPLECNFLRKKSAFDCNCISKKTINELIRLVEERKLLLKGEVPASLLEKLLTATKQSPLVEQRVKNAI